MPRIGKTAVNRSTKRKIQKNILIFKLSCLRQSQQTFRSASLVSFKKPARSVGHVHKFHDIEREEPRQLDNQTEIEEGSFSIEDSVVAESANNSQHVQEELKISAIVRGLKVWAVKNNIKGTAITSLLRLLKQHSCFCDLPSDFKSFLGTPRDVPLIEIEPGKYCHFNLAKVLKTRLEHYQLNEVHLQFNVDGLPISKSSSQQFWPILCHITELKRSPPFVVGIYYGEDKPRSSNQYLSQFVQDLRTLQHVTNDGGNRISIKIHSFVFDAPARSFILNIKGHTGYHCCHKCTVEGDNLNHRMLFPELNCELRSDYSVRNKVHEEHHTGEPSELEKLNIDLVKDIPLDYQHLICLGTVRKLLYLWIRGKVNVFRLPAHAVHTLSKRLIELKYYVSSEFPRKPRSLIHLKNWKATEYRTFLLYTGPVVLAGILPPAYYQHFLALHVAITILCSRKFQVTHLNYANHLLKYFVQNFGTLYGIETISYNIHNLIHLGDDSKRFGVLDNFATFRFENHLGKIKQLVRSGNKPLQQVYNRITELEQALKPGPESEKIFKEFELSCKRGDNCCILKDGVVIIVKNIVENNSEFTIFGSVLTHSVPLYTVPCSSLTFGISKYTKQREIIKVNSNLVNAKALAFPSSTGFTVFPLLHMSSQ